VHFAGNEADNAKLLLLRKALLSPKIFGIIHSLDFVHFPLFKLNAKRSISGRAGVPVTRQNNKASATQLDPLGTAVLNIWAL
jgi:hypothetical protein